MENGKWNMCQFSWNFHFHSSSLVDSIDDYMIQIRCGCQSCYMICPYLVNWDNFRQEKAFYEWLHALPSDCRLVLVEVTLVSTGTAMSVLAVIVVKPSISLQNLRLASKELHKKSYKHKILCVDFVIPRWFVTWRKLVKIMWTAEKRARTDNVCQDVEMDRCTHKVKSSRCRS